MHPTNTFKKVTSSPFLYILHFSVKATLFHERKPFIPRQAHTSLQQQQSFFIKLLLLIPISWRKHQVTIIDDAQQHIYKVDCITELLVSHYTKCPSVTSTNRLTKHNNRKISSITFLDKSITKEVCFPLNPFFYCFLQYRFSFFGDKLQPFLKIIILRYPCPPILFPIDDVFAN